MSRARPPTDPWLRLSAGEEIEITFSYWDGSGHRKTVKVTCLEPRSLLGGAFGAASSECSLLFDTCVCVSASILQMKKGNTIQNFLQKALEVLRKDFSELRLALRLSRFRLSVWSS